MFDHCRVTFEQYVVALRKKGMTKRTDHLLQEVRARLRQLQWLHARLLQLERELEEEALNSGPPGAARPAVLKQVFHEASAADSDPQIQSQHLFQKSDELRVLLETFYYSAHRVRDILRDHESELPGLGSFEAKGIRDVRNHLVEHPSRDKGVLVYSTACGGSVGPQLRLLRWSLDPPGTQDQGLHYNAKEFVDALETWLSRAVSGRGHS
jgi:hypothetical protein